MRVGMILFALAVLLAPVALFVPRATVVLGGLAAVMAVSDRETRVHVADLMLGPLGIALAVALLWPLVSAFWAPDPVRSLTVWASLLAITAAGLALVALGRTAAGQGPDRVATGLAIAGVLFVALAGIELATGRWITGLLRGPTLVEILSRGSALTAVFLFPIAIATWRRFGPLAGAALGIASLTAIVALPMAASIVAAGIAIAVFAAVWAWPRAGWALLHLGVLVCLLVLPWFALTYDPGGLSHAATGIPENWLHRLHVWNFAMERYLERPFAGWGLDAARLLPGGTGQVPQLRGHAPYLPLHPHNMAVQLWLELGAVGASLAAGLVSVVLTRFRLLHTERPVRAAIAATFAAWFTIAYLSFGLWQNWWVAVPWIAAALWRAIADPRRPQPAT